MAIHWILAPLNDSTKQVQFNTWLACHRNKNLLNMIYNITTTIAAATTTTAEKKVLQHNICNVALPGVRVGVRQRIIKSVLF